MGLLRQVLAAYIAGGEHGDEGRGSGDSFHVGTPVRFLTLHQAHRADYFEAVFARRFDSLYRRRSGGAYVVHYYYARAFFAEAFDALASAVLLLRFADEESVQRSAGHRDGDNDGIGAHGESTDGVGMPTLGAHFLEKNLADELRSARVERGGAAIDVVVAGAAGGKFKFA